MISGKKFISFISIAFRLYLAAFAIAVLGQIVVRGYYKEFSAAYLFMAIAGLAKAVQIWYKGNVFNSLKTLFTEKRINYKDIRKYLVIILSLDIYFIFSDIFFPKTDYSRESAISSFEQSTDFLSKAMVVLNNKGLEIVCNFIFPNLYGFEAIILILILNEFEKRSLHRNNN